MAKPVLPTTETLARTMVRPKWIAALLLALAIAAGFAWLGQWQLERAVQSGHVVEHPTETVKPLNSVATVNSPPTSAGIGQLVRVRGTFAPHDYGMLVGRLNDGTAGYWVIDRFTPSADDRDGRQAQLAVARGWAPTEHDAKAAIARLEAESPRTVTLVGRLLPSEAPEAPKDHTDPFVMKDMSVAALVNMWHGIGNSDIYSSYVVEHGTPPAGLQAIYSPPPIEQATVNWLNIFYAAEWAIFAGFAIFLWYRLVKDAWEKEREDAEAEYERALADWEASSHRPVN
ncbi:SURF1 family protein [Humibacter sp.]|uniref:SURF1 family protein n=1 Tax=Humibacter sp. TaxID=1940291 RepID=UPI002CC4DB73|nr:SURF1 family cytochrome oxidase biogenesis protein [Humibacter sp.]HVX06500.1 SURF1 family cytochrome oxidase biogenesis protein [Humibacter sp.]